MSIRILSPQTAAKIAAGEVIIRPASVVKELLENSLDAGASRIDVYIEEGGKKVIRVTDNGEGIAAAEVELAVRRFATSKLSSADDLRNITSYGFRGEALASIAEISEIVIETQRSGTENGVSLRVKAGKIVERKEIVRTPGTTISVSNLFFNLPARHAFLRSNSYERRLVLAVIRNYALLQHSVCFDISNRTQTLMSFREADDWLERLRDIYPELKDIELIPLDGKHRQLTVKGFVTRPDKASEGQRIQHIFFNGRPVQYRSIYKAVMEGFGSQLVYLTPVFILKLDSPPEFLDANIHPTKTEVRYQDERFLFDFVSQLVRQALHEQAVDTFNPSQLTRATHPFASSSGSRTAEVSPGFFEPFSQTPSSLPSSPSSPFSPTSESFERESLEAPTGYPYVQSGFWQLQNLYVLAQVSSGLIIVDQHAAHERILYEEMLEQLSAVPRQRLLFPIIIDLSPEEFATFEEIADSLLDLGLEVKPFGPNQVIIETLPADAKIDVLELRDLFREFNEQSEVKLGNRDKMAALIACKGAIKEGRSLSQAEMESLINRLFHCKTPFFCPHGRPTVVKFTMDELAKRFGRI